MARKDNKSGFDLLPVLALILSVLGVAGFIFLFVRDFNIYWLILSPVIFVVYQFPAFVIFWLYKKKRGGRDERDERDGQNQLDRLDERGGRDERGL